VVDNKKLTGMDTNGMRVDPAEEHVASEADILDSLLGPSPIKRVNLLRTESTPGSEGPRPLTDRPLSIPAHNLANPYGEGNHRRISWRKAWVIDHEQLSAQHVPTRFTLQFTPHPDGGYTAQPVDVPPFGPDGTLAMSQMFGLRELLKDGWELFHTAMHKR
jgi:hypothetical protein